MLIIYLYIPLFLSLLILSWIMDHAFSILIISRCPSKLHRMSNSNYASATNWLDLCSPLYLITKLCHIWNHYNWALVSSCRLPSTNGLCWSPLNPNPHEYLPSPPSPWLATIQLGWWWMMRTTTRTTEFVFIAILLLDLHIDSATLYKICRDKLQDDNAVWRIMINLVSVKI